MDNSLKKTNRLWRLIDTGLRPAAENIAINRSMLEAHQLGHVTNTLRFLRYKPSALLGYHQSAQQELHVDYCKNNNIAIQRRITGGGAIYFDTTQIGWELYFDKQFFETAKMDDISARVCTAAASGISALGVDAKFRPRNDIEVNGKKISGTGGSFDGSSVLYQGTLLIEFDVEKMLRVLRIPIEKLTDKAIESARDRVVNLAYLLGYTPSMEEVKSSMVAAFKREFEIDFEQCDRFGEQENLLYESALAEIDDEAWINLIDSPRQDMPAVTEIHRCDGGTLRVSIILGSVALRLKQIWINGDFFVSPKRAVVDLEACLKNVAIVDVKNIVEGFFSQHEVEFLQMTGLDIYAAIKKAISVAQDKSKAKDSVLADG